jgi:hypothetical protein
MFGLATINVYATDQPLRCEGHNYENISGFPELEEGQCYGTCEERSIGLTCDIEKIKEN